MAKIKLGMLARTVSAHAVAKLLERDGRLLLRAAPRGKGVILAELPVVRTANFAVSAGRAIIRFEDALGVLRGDPVWAQCVTKEGELVFEIEVGPKAKTGEKGAPLQLAPLTVHPHGTVSVPELVYVQPE